MSVGAVAAASAAFVLLALAVVLALALRRARRSADARVAEAVGSLSSQVEAIVRELETTLGRAQQEGRHTRFLVELAGTIDLDDVLGRTLQGAQAISGADAVLLTVDQPAGTPLAATLGLSAEEAEVKINLPDGHGAYAPPTADGEAVVPDTAVTAG